ncbi:hypothetical protein B4U80_03066 [Leptotrombidium deliense]|uniref:Bardet-Biedl syndrome 7 protein-like protein n=1 Tax=Leptotrombidium deliense TaxID=299467 RepID=A0A443SGP5_9ACAR|nr:hypothetical protein B4U80_03066 [Leptotrombidium deliense]
MDSKLNRLDFMQVGLTSKNALSVLDPGYAEDSGEITAVVGDHSGSVHCFQIRENSMETETVFKTLPGPNAKISCIQVVGNVSGSPKIMVAFGSSVIRGLTRKGKQFFGVELNNLTEPIKHFQLRWPNELFVCGNYIFNHYLISDESSSKSNVSNKNFYVSPGKIVDMVVVEDKYRRRIVPVLLCEDRLLRILKDSSCQYEIETCGVPSAMFSYGTVTSKENDFLFTYGTLEGKTAMVKLDFTQSALEAKHRWEIPEKGTRAPVHCISAMEKSGELYIGRSDGNVEIWTFSESCDADGHEFIDMDSSPLFRLQHNCSESITSICVCRDGTLLLCSTFTGVIFGLTRTEIIRQSVSTIDGTTTTELQQKIDFLKCEISELELKLTAEKEEYQELTARKNRRGQPKVGLSALPYFAINDSFLIQEDATYLLTLEVEVPIDCVIIQSDIPLDLIDCERNSAVISFNDNLQNEVLATFRCQANTTRLEVKVGSIEGQSGLLRAYIMTRMTPKGCQLKTYQIKALSLHKRKYKDDPDLKTFFNKLTLKGGFSLYEAHTWLSMCLPEIPEKLVTSNTQSTIDYNFVSTLTDTVLVCNCGKGSLNFESDNISTISILKDYITREATKKSIALEMNLNVNEGSVSSTLRKLYPKLKALLKLKEKEMMSEAIKELSITDPEVAKAMMDDINNIQIDVNVAVLSLDRLYGLITDLFIDYNKMKGNTSKSSVANIKNKINGLVEIIQNFATDEHNVDVFIEKLNQFWGVQTFV